MCNHHSKYCQCSSDERRRKREVLASERGVGEAANGGAGEIDEASSGDEDRDHFGLPLATRLEHGEAHDRSKPVCRSKTDSSHDDTSQS